MQLPAWVGTKIANIPQGFRGEIKLKVINGGVTALYIEEIVDKHTTRDIDFSQKGKVVPRAGAWIETTKGKDETDLG